MAATRGHPEFNRRLGEFFTHGTSPCPDCGLDMPAGDHDLRMAHYAVCGGKRVDAPLIEIDPEFKALIRKQTKEENAELEVSILSEGCRDALIVWRFEGKLILVDGHHRYALCLKHDIAYKVLEREFGSRDDVIIWMVHNQLARRNLNKYKRTKLALRLEDAIQAKARTRQLATLRQGDAIPVPQNSAEREEPLETREEVAKLANTSRDTVSKVKKISESAPLWVQERADDDEISVNLAHKLTKALDGKPEIVSDVAMRHADDNPEKVAILASLYESSKRDGSNETFQEIAASGGFHYAKDSKDTEMSAWCDFAEADIRTIKAALASIAKQHIQIKRDERIAEIVAQGTTELNEAPALFNVVYADPPWRYEHSISDSRAIENQYPTMLLEEICALPVATIITNPAILFLWATSPKLDEAMTVLKAWGFIYKTCMVWDKERIGMGYYARQQHELLLIGTCGDMPTPPPSERPASVIRERRTETHSQKPTSFRELITRMYPDFHKVELFAREETEGWYGWGYESNRS